MCLDFFSVHLGLGIIKIRLLSLIGCYFGAKIQNGVITNHTNVLFFFFIFYFY